MKLANKGVGIMCSYELGLRILDGPMSYFFGEMIVSSCTSIVSCGTLILLKIPKTTFYSIDVFHVRMSDEKNYRL